MLTVIKNLDGDIQGVCEWCLCDRNGERFLGGGYIWIHELEVAKNYERKGIIKKIIETIAEKTPNAHTVYFRRHKYGLRIKVFRKEQFLKFASCN